MSVLPAFDLVRPHSVTEAIGAIADGGVPYAGGTELLLAMRAGLLRPETLVDLKALPELAFVENDDGRVSIGGSATHTAVASSPLVREHAPVLAQVLREVGNPRVRASGTLGGNLCFGEPKSDVAPILIALEASVTLRGKNGSRELPVEEFAIGPYTTSLGDSEILTSISIPTVHGRIAYAKHQTMERPTVGVAIAVSGDGATRVVVGAVGPAPQVFDADDPNDVDPADIAASVEVLPDLTGGERYKRHMTGVTVRRALEQTRGGK